MDYTPEQILEMLRAGEVPADLRGSLARGIFPLGPAAMLESLILLSDDDEGEIRDEAVKSLRKVPPSLVLGVCSAKATSPALLDSLARLFSRNDQLLEKILLNPAAADVTLAYLATLPHPTLLEILGLNQGRIQGAPVILKNLRENTATPALILRLWDEREARRKDRAERREAARAQEDEEKEEPLSEDLAPLFIDNGEGGAGKTDKGRGGRAEELKKLTIHQMLKEMTAGQMVALAVKGNGEVRKILIRSKNRIIATKVLQNPRITDSEVEHIAKSTNVSEDVLRIVGNKREWLRQSLVMRALVNNPKTPAGISMGLLKRLSLRELEILSKNRNVPEVLRNTSRKMYKTKLEMRR
jgi:hypothetical protein